MLSHAFFRLLRFAMHNPLIAALLLQTSQWRILRILKPSPFISGLRHCKAVIQIKSQIKFRRPKPTVTLKLINNYSPLTIPLQTFHPKISDLQPQVSIKEFHSSFFRLPFLFQDRRVSKLFLHLLQSLHFGIFLSIYPYAF